MTAITVVLADDHWIVRAGVGKGDKYTHTLAINRASRREVNPFFGGVDAYRKIFEALVLDFRWPTLRGLATLTRLARLNSA